MGLISKKRLKELCMYNLAKWQLGLQAKRTVYKYLKRVNQASKTQSSATLGKWEIWVTAFHAAHWPVLSLGCCLGEKRNSLRLCHCPQQSLRERGMLNSEGKTKMNQAYWTLASRSLPSCFPSCQGIKEDLETLV